ncbi:MAG: hypothetical protein V3T61_00830 [Acidobacteriota bacterium]
MGKILGWATIQGVSVPDPEPEPEPEFDVDRMVDYLSLGFYRNAKEHYLRAKRAFFDFARRSQIREARNRARQNTRHAANLQMLGVESSESIMRPAQEEMKVASHAAWRIYQSSRDPKSDEAKAVLVQVLSEAQLVGVENVDPAIMEKIQKEVNKLIDSGQLKMAGRENR